MHNALDVMQQFELLQYHTHNTPTKKAANAAFLSLLSNSDITLIPSTLSIRLGGSVTHLRQWLTETARQHGHIHDTHQRPCQTQHQ